MSSKQRNGTKKKGFRVGPQLAKGAYKGHLEKIKKTLIHKAKVKREYYKELKKMENSKDSSEESGGEDEEEREIERAKEERKRQYLQEVELSDSGEDIHSESEDEENPYSKGKRTKYVNRTELEKQNKTKKPKKKKSKDTPQAPPSPIAPEPEVLPSKKSWAPVEPKKSRLTREEIQKQRDEKLKNRLKNKEKWGRKTRNGQPKLGTRVEVLLEKIKNSS